MGLAPGTSLAAAIDAAGVPSDAAFLDEYAPRTPRTMLPSATEHLPPGERVAYRQLR